jgi:hypothetical protein
VIDELAYQYSHGIVTLNKYFRKDTQKKLFKMEKCIEGIKSIVNYIL